MNRIKNLVWEAVQSLLVSSCQLEGEMRVKANQNDLCCLEGGAYKWRIVPNVCPGSRRNRRWCEARSIKVWSSCDVARRKDR